MKRKFRPFQVWVVVDREGFYAALPFRTKNEAIAEKEKWAHLREAKFTVVKAMVR